MTDTTSLPPPALLALDWGTSSLRAFLMDRSGAVRDQRSGDQGIQNLPEPGNAGFERAFAAIAGDWIARWPALPVVAGGMVGSAQGWREAPYVPCPADLGTLAGRAAVVDSALGVRILIAPGLIHEPPAGAPDVLRGEEIQIAGVLADHPEWAKRSCMVLPGTHSKWVSIDGARLAGFSTYMTGELYAVLRRHSILGRLMPASQETNGGVASGDDADRAFAMGVQAASDSGPGDLPHQLFATRTLGLTGRLSHAALGDYLSGLLIGHELRSGLAKRTGADDAPLLLIGEGALCRRYEYALALMNVRPAARYENTAPRGLFGFAAAAGLVSPLSPANGASA